MAKCGCASTVCTCKVTGGTNVQVTGTGTLGDPYVIGVPATLVLTVADTSSVDLTLIGSGTTVDPYVLSGTSSSGGSGGGSVPAGALMPFAGTAAPTGWLIAGGQTVSRSTYSALFAALGGVASPYGIGDGSTTFNLPDLRGRVPAGLDNMAGTAAGRLSTAVTLGIGQGQQAVTLTAGQVPPHAHTGSTIAASAFSHTHLGASHVHSMVLEWQTDASSTGSGRRVTDLQHDTGGGHSTGGADTIATNGAGALETDTPTGATAKALTIAPGPAATSTSVVQPTIALNYLIKY